MYCFLPSSNLRMMPSQRLLLIKEAEVEVCSALQEEDLVVEGEPVDQEEEEEEEEGGGG